MAPSKVTPSAQPILVTGAHRTGTTWVGKILAVDPHTAYLSEPLNALHRPGVFAAPVLRWYTYITAENESAFLPAFHRMLDYRYGLGAEIRSLRSPRDAGRMLRDLRTFVSARLLRRRAIIKDPFAVFSAAWFAAQLNCHVVFTVRHPAGFASSLKRLGWFFDMRDLLDQPRLMKDHLEPHRGAMQALRADDVVGQAALLWKMIYGFVHRAMEQNPALALVRQEDLARAPTRAFGQLYQDLGLEYTPRVERLVLRSSSTENPSEPSTKNVHSIHLDSRASLDTWKARLSAQEKARIRDMTDDIAQYYYPSADWD
jgi:hypothetical protein